MILLVLDTVTHPYELSLRNILPLLEEIHDAFQLGVQLGIDTAHLRVIEKDHKYDSKRLMLEVIDFWLKNSTNPPSWKTLAEAVRNLGTQHTQLASRLGSMESQPQAVFSPSSGKIMQRGWFVRDGYNIANYTTSSISSFSAVSCLVVIPVVYYTQVIRECIRKST